ncbi:MAG: FtsB family cell division protein [Peptostreptococcaceae bacterium]
MNLRKRFAGQYIGLCLFLLSMVFTMAGGCIFQIIKYKDYNAEITELSKQVKQADEEIKELKAIESGQNDNDLEDVARRKLKMVKPGEIIYLTEGEIEEN